MIDSYGRSAYQKYIVDPVLPNLSFLAPTSVTVFGMIFGIFIIPLLAFKYSNMALLMLLVSGFLDTLDGSLARFKKETTPFGAALDIVGDRVVEFSVILGLYLFQPEERALSCLLMLGTILICITSFLVVGIFTQNTTEKGFHYSPGLIERGEAFVFFSVMILIPSIFGFLSWVFSGLVVVTALIRLMQFRNSSKQKESYGRSLLR